MDLLKKTAQLAGSFRKSLSTFGLVAGGFTALLFMQARDMFSSGSSTAHADTPHTSDGGGDGGAGGGGAGGGGDGGGSDPCFGPDPMNCTGIDATPDCNTQDPANCNNSSAGSCGAPGGDPGGGGGGGGGGAGGK